MQFILYRQITDKNCLLRKSMSLVGRNWWALQKGKKSLLCIMKGLKCDN